MRFHALGPLEIHTGGGAVDAYVNWAGLLGGMGDSVYARRDVEAVLALAPSDLHLLFLRGRLLAEDNDIPAAVAADSGPVEAWAPRGALADQDGDLDAPAPSSYLTSTRM